MNLEKEKVLFISKHILFTHNDEFRNEGLEILDKFIKSNIKVVVIARQQTINNLREKIPYFYKNKVNFLSRYFFKYGNKNDILKDSNYIYSIIGVVDEDAHIAFNHKIPLFNPEKYIGNNLVKQKVKKYGLPFNNIDDVIRCMNIRDVNLECYFDFTDENSNKVISLYDANTFSIDDDEIEIKKIFQTNLKTTLNKIEYNILLILLFNMINYIKQLSENEIIDFWGIFPSSNPEKVNTPVYFIKEYIRTMNNSKPYNGTDIIERIKPMREKHMRNDRFEIKCDIDFETLRINPELVSKIKNKTVCIIDDYITNGYSSEATKHLLLKAGVKKVIFISFGKFGRKYFQTQYNINGDVSNNYEYEFVCEQNVSNGNQYYNSKHKFTINY